MGQDIYFELGVCFEYPKSNPYYQWKQFKMYNFQHYVPFSTYTFYHHQAPHSRALARACSALVRLPVLVKAQAGILTLSQTTSFRLSNYHKRVCRQQFKLQ